MKSVEATVKLEMRLVNNQTIRVCGSNINLSGSRDAAVLVLVTSIGGRRISEEIVAITLDVEKTLTLITYAKANGEVTLSPDLE